MGGFKVSEPVNMWNYAIEAEYGFNGENLIRSAFFGSAKEFAEWLDAFDYGNGDVFGWTGDSATMNAVDSFRNEPRWAMPEFITEYNVNDGSSEIIGADQFHNLRRMFAKDRENYRIHRHFCGRAKVYSVMYIGNGDAELSSYVWHVPFGADEMPIS
ncbi:hypothetical protein SEA_FAUST_261 [Streptomyces phage Faust]|uniref:Uncharacterized protein n=1 Tax=Streptomyces phage Faust TaxID=2767565 RepID=A0A7G9UZ78_9CAUD|nr:hypothetical protein PP456_gp026 [Streptomyces phage Faust]QNN99333.1 hypothetical protein SEA_FAUST_261 [Streptomyces phage Faust]